MSAATEAKRAPNGLSVHHPDADVCVDCQEPTPGVAGRRCEDCASLFEDAVSDLNSDLRDI